MPSTPARTIMCRRCSHQLNVPYHALRLIALVNNWHLVRTALHLAAELHHGQLREAGGPYIYHPIRVTLKLWTRGIHDECILAAALLHDLLEDCEERFDKKMLGRFYALDARTVAIVQVLTKGTPHNADHYYGRIAANSEASLIKLADRADNLDMNGTFTQARARKYVEETKRYIIPLTMPKRNGSGHFRMAFEALHSEIRILTRKAEQDFNLRDDTTKPVNCHARNRTDSKARNSGAHYSPIARFGTAVAPTG